MLDDGDGDVDASTQMAMRGYPAGAPTVFEYDGTWAELAEGSCRVVAFHAEPAFHGSVSRRSAPRPSRNQPDALRPAGQA